MIGSGCGLGDTPFDQVEAASVVSQPTWTQHVKPRMDFYCAPCHSPDTMQGTSAGYDFTSFGIVSGLFSEVERVAVKERSMPPGAAPRITAEDWAILKRWEANGFPK